MLPSLPYISLFAEEDPDRRRGAAAAIGWLAKVGAFVRVARGGGGGEGSGSTMSSLLPDEEDIEADQAHLYLNVYDLTPINKYLYWLGLGVFHSGIEVHGMEFGFGAHEYPTSGVFEVEPKSYPGFVFRRSVLLGSINMSRSEFRSFMGHLSGGYHGDTYHLIAKNCNHFTDDVCIRLTGKPIPGWVNRLARLGAFCNCLLPESIQLTTVTPLADHPAHSDNGDLQSASSFVMEESDDEEGSDLRLLTTPNGDVSFLRDKQVMIAREHV